MSGQNRPPPSGEAGEEDRASSSRLAWQIPDRVCNECRVVELHLEALPGEVVGLCLALHSYSGQPCAAALGHLVLELLDTSTGRLYHTLCSGLRAEHTGFLFCKLVRGPVALTGVSHPSGLGSSFPHSSEGNRTCYLPQATNQEGEMVNGAGAGSPVASPMSQPLHVDGLDTPMGWRVKCTQMGASGRTFADLIPLMQVVVAEMVIFVTAVSSLPPLLVQRVKLCCVWVPQPCQ